MQTFTIITVGKQCQIKFSNSDIIIIPPQYIHKLYKYLSDYNEREFYITINKDSVQIMRSGETFK